MAGNDDRPAVQDWRGDIHVDAEGSCVRVLIQGVGRGGRDYDLDPLEAKYFAYRLLAAASEVELSRKGGPLETAVSSLLPDTVETESVPAQEAV